MAISSLSLPLFTASILGQSIYDKKTVLFTVVIDLMKSTETQSVIYAWVLILMFLIAFTFYFLNGLGVIYNKYSCYAAFMNIIFIFPGLYLVTILNKNMILPFVGTSMASINIGPGFYFITIIGFLYLFLKKYVNRAIRI